MRIQATVQLDGDDNFSMTAEDAAHAVLEALGGSLADDSCNLSVLMPTVNVGAPPAVDPLVQQQARDMAANISAEPMA